MRAFWILLITLLLITQVQAVVLTCAKEDGNVVRIDYNSTDEKSLPIAFALDVTVDNGATIEKVYDYKVGDSNAASRGFGIFPASIKFDENNEIVDWGSPVGGGSMGTSAVTLGMASRYTGPENAPSKTGTLCRVLVNTNGAQTVNFKVAQNIGWGGVMLENGTPAKYSAVGVTLGTVTPPPAAPSNMIATASVLSMNPPTVSLTWADNSNNEIGFLIQRATNTAFTAGLTTFTVGANLTTYTDTTVLIYTRYYYRIRAFDAIGDSAWSKRATVRTPRQLPLAPANLTVGTITRNSVALSWTDNATDETGFVIQRARNAAFTTGVAKTTVNTPNLTARTMIGLARNTTYYYRVAARNAAGNSTWSNVVTFTTLP